MDVASEIRDQYKREELISKFCSRILELLVIRQRDFQGGSSVEGTDCSCILLHLPTSLPPACAAYLRSWYKQQEVDAYVQMHLLAVEAVSGKEFMFRKSFA